MEAATNLCLIRATAVKQYRKYGCVYSKTIIEKRRKAA